MHPLILEKEKPRPKIPKLGKRATAALRAYRAQSNAHSLCFAVGLGHVTTDAAIVRHLAAAAELLAIAEEHKRAARPDGLARLNRAYSEVGWGTLESLEYREP